MCEVGVELREPRLSQDDVVLGRKAIENAQTELSIGRAYSIEKLLYCLMQDTSFIDSVTKWQKGHIYTENQCR